MVRRSKTFCITAIMRDRDRLAINQRRIASILSAAYDDLIEQLAAHRDSGETSPRIWRRMVRPLPLSVGHENVRMVVRVGTGAGKWSKQTADATFETLGGGTPSGTNQNIGTTDHQLVCTGLI